MNIHEAIEALSGMLDNLVLLGVLTEEEEETFVEIEEVFVNYVAEHEGKN